MTSKITIPGWTGSPTEDRLPDLRQERAVQTRAQVLRAAAEEFAEKGFKSTSIQDVAKRVGMTKGAVYFHFPNKEILAIAVVEAHYSRWPELLEGILAEGHPPLDTVVRVLDGAAQAFATDIVVQAGARLQLERSLIDAELPQPYVGWTQLLAHLLTSAREAGELREGVDPEAAARALVSGFFGVQHVSDTLTGRADLLQRWPEFRDLAMASIRA
ncbi:ScbR family autoregulator-binding transcription factor [Streptomyces yokosukanensis]|uniref:ScbR family autoregulator-binding transcription factor n=1 Tax=Streptomyces yokosukanensis TaxID=67386 RepID=UPI00099EC11C|nr:ScbR family autoregulator-binding transcription factor [Streptomyces yokosukanensis]